MSAHDTKADAFLALHAGPAPLLLPNPWDPGSARLFAWLGFEALATTSSGFAATQGAWTGRWTATTSGVTPPPIVAATDLPVSADLENGFGDDPE